MTNLIKQSLAFLMLVLFSAASIAAEPVSKSRFKGVAIGGSDTVAYHSLQREPQASVVKGSKSFVVKYKGANWHFADQASAAKFEAEPEKYSPAYNGHCANALSLGKGLVKTDGAHWEIYEDKLYLFYAADGRTRWVDGDWKDYKVIADSEWAKLSQ